MKQDWWKRLVTRIQTVWLSRPDSERDNILSILEIMLNYALAALSLAIPIHWMLHTPYWSCALSLIILIPYAEHYYAWFMQGWKGRTQ